MSTKQPRFFQPAPQHFINLSSLHHELLILKIALKEINQRLCDAENAIFFHQSVYRHHHSHSKQIKDNIEQLNNFLALQHQLFSNALFRAPLTPLAKANIPQLLTQISSINIFKNQINQLLLNWRQKQSTAREFKEQVSKLTKAISTSNDLDVLLDIPSEIQELLKLIECSEK